MSCMMETCPDCVETCLRDHGKKRVTKFLKVMIGPVFSQLLFIPPKLLNSVKPLINKETFVRDVNGKQWDVKLAHVDGSFALQQGWDSFVSDHDIGFGDILIFHYIEGSHFLANIFDKSACEKLEFSYDTSEKKKTHGRPRRTKKKRSRDEHCTSIPAVSESDIPASTMLEVEETTKWMLNRDIKNQEAEDRKFVIDLSQYENEKMQGNNADDNVGSHTDELLLAAKDSVPREAGSGSTAGVGMTTETQYKLPTISDKNSQVKSPESFDGGENFADMPNILESDAVVMESVPCQSYDTMNIDNCDFGTGMKSNSADISCLVGANSKLQIELPACLPSTLLNDGLSKAKMEVQLEDPMMRSWPVVYFKRNGFHMLTNGWGAFSAENNIEEGDTCHIGIKDEAQAKYTVRISKAPKHISLTMHSL